MAWFHAKHARPGVLDKLGFRRVSVAYLTFRVVKKRSFFKKACL